jgi:hypothetical protein
LLGERQPYLEGGGIIAARVGGLSVGLRQRERGRRRYKSNRSDEQAQPTHGGIPLAGNLPQITGTREGSPRPRTWLADYENVRTKNRREASNDIQATWTRLPVLGQRPDRIARPPPLPANHRQPVTIAQRLDFQGILEPRRLTVGVQGRHQADRLPGILAKIRRRFCLVRATAEKIGKN